MLQHGKPGQAETVNINPASPEHPYHQLAAGLREQIQRGQITSQLPSLTALSAQTGLATGTELADLRGCAPAGVWSVRSRQAGHELGLASALYAPGIR